MVQNLQDDPIWQQIDSAAYLFLNRLFEPCDNALVIVLEEAIANASKTGPTILPGGVELPGDSCPIEPTTECRIFTISWKNYVSYCVTEEMHGSTGNYETERFSGRLIRIYEQSNFLEFIAKNTGAHFEEYRHIQIACLNHVIDIVASSAPQLTSVSRTEAELEDEPQAPTLQ